MLNYNSAIIITTTNTTSFNAHFAYYPHQLGYGHIAHYYYHLTISPITLRDQIDIKTHNSTRQDFPRGKFARETDGVTEFRAY
jgi:hypothetical protein